MVGDYYERKLHPHNFSRSKLWRLYGFVGWIFASGVKRHHHAELSIPLRLFPKDICKDEQAFLFPFLESIACYDIITIRWGEVNGPPQPRPQCFSVDYHHSLEARLTASRHQHGTLYRALPNQYITVHKRGTFTPQIDDVVQTKPCKVQNRGVPDCTAPPSVLRWLYDLLCHPTVMLLEIVSVWLKRAHAAVGRRNSVLCSPLLFQAAWFCVRWGNESHLGWAWCRRRRRTNLGSTNLI